MITLLCSPMAVMASAGASVLLMQAMFEGKWVFVGALLLVLIWLIVMPRQLVGHAKQVPPPWRNVRLWAIVICAVQIWIYWRFG
jgi:hypothetical protein